MQYFIGACKIYKFFWKRYLSFESVIRLSVCFSASTVHLSMPIHKILVCTLFWIWVCLMDTNYFKQICFILHVLKKIDDKHPWTRRIFGGIVSFVCSCWSLCVYFFVVVHLSNICSGSSGMVLEGSLPDFFAILEEVNKNSGNPE